MLLLDTCSLLWLAAKQSELSLSARAAISDNASNLFVSSMSAYEIGFKTARGAFKLPSAPRAWFYDVLAHHGVVEIPFAGEEALAAAELPRLHSDPFDRAIIATALIHRLPVLTPDHYIAMYPDVATVW
jgi:PIN domain nuclease of toxin-antitoxin system